MRFTIAVLCLVLANAASAQERTVALTFDDLPLVLEASPGISTVAERLAETRRVNKAIMKALKKHHAWATAFVNEKKVQADGNAEEGRAILNEWIKSGYDLGNHTFSHADLNDISVQEFEREVVDGEASVKPLMNNAGRPLRYLRFPFNHSGATEGKHAEVADFLKQRGYEVATCTVENEDWVFAHAYKVMLERKDTDAAKRLRTAYIQFTAQELAYFGQLHQQIFGHELPQVMVLHANRLNADVIEQVLRVFEKARYRFVTLEQAQSDPAYLTLEKYPTVYGPMWGYRWARTLGVKVDGSREPNVPGWIENYN